MNCPDCAEWSKQSDDLGRALALALERERALREALEGLVRMNEQHNAAVETVIGRPLGWTDEYLNTARAALARREGK